MVLSIKVIFFASLATVAMCQQNLDQFAREEPDLPARYAFHYEVSNPTDGDMKSHSETRDGDDVTGEYSVLQPDGCIRHVRYRAGKAGFFPEVRYEGNCDPRFYTAPKAGPENIGFATNEGNEVPNQDENLPFVNFNVPVAAVQTAEIRDLPASHQPQMVSYAYKIDPPSPAYRR